MYKVKVNEQFEFELELGEDGSKGTCNGEEFNLDSVEKADRTHHIIHNNKSYTVEIVSIDFVSKDVTVKVNNREYDVSIKDENDLLLEKLGMDMSSANKFGDLKAPMPGLVLEVLVKEGDVLEKNAPLLVLEAMKMENMLKAPAAVEVGEVHVKAGDAIEKNEKLITFK